MARNAVFISTTGQTDIQVVVPNETGSLHRYGLTPRHVRDFQLACVNGDIPWTFRPLDQEDVEERRDVSLDYDSGTHQLVSRLSQTRDDSLVTVDCRQGITLCAPLLGRCLRDICARSLVVQHIMLLTTRRTPPESSEPVGVYTLLHLQLAGAFGLSQEEVTEAIFLSELDLYEVDRDGQRHLRASAARRLDDAMRNLAARFPDAVALVADIAGIPETKPVLAASVSYRFRRMHFVRPTEPGRDTVSRRETLVSPAESLATRASVTRLIHQGAFLEAAAMARHASTAAHNVEPWRRWLRDVAYLLEGLAPRDFDNRLEGYPATSLLGPCLRRIWGEGNAPTLLVAFHVEAALRRQSLSLALRETFTFIEIARKDLIGRLLSQPNQLCLDWLNRHFFPQKAKNLSQETLDYLAREHGGQRKIFLRDEELESRLVGNLPEPVQKLLGQFDDAARPARELRNLATHSFLEDSGIDEARRHLAGSGLWSESGTSRFLDAVPVRGLLGWLGMPEPANLYGEMIKAILHDLDAFSFRDE